VAQDHVHFERVGVEAGGAAQLFDREIDLVRDEEVEAEDVMRRLPRAPAVDPFAVAKLVALPGLANRQAGQQRDERREERGIGGHTDCPTYSASSASHMPCARRIDSINPRAAPWPPL